MHLAQKHSLRHVSVFLLLLGLIFFFIMFLLCFFFFYHIMYMIFVWKSVNASKKFFELFKNKRQLEEDSVRWVSVWADVQGFSIREAGRGQTLQVNCNPHEDPVFGRRVSEEKSKFYIPYYTFSRMRVNKKKSKEQGALQQMVCPPPSPEIINLLCHFTFRTRNELEAEHAGEALSLIQMCHGFLLSILLTNLMFT